MIEQYRTVRRPAVKEIVIRKSRFIGHVKPVQSEEEAIEFIEEIKKKHWDLPIIARRTWSETETNGRSNPTMGSLAAPRASQCWKC